LKCDGTRAETRFRLSAKRTSPFKSAGVSVQSTAGSRGVRIYGSNAGYSMFRGTVKSTGYQFPLHFPNRASPCDITFQLDSTFLLRQPTPFKDPTCALQPGNISSPQRSIYLPTVTPCSLRRQYLTPPSGLPDLSSLVFFLQGYLEGKIYDTHPTY
jgi:hypothetical protein